MLPRLHDAATSNPSSPAGAGPICIHICYSSYLCEPARARALVCLEGRALLLFGSGAATTAAYQTRSAGAMLLGFLVLRAAGLHVLSMDPDEVLQQQRCSSLESWWANYAPTLSLPAPLPPPAELPQGRGLLAAPLLAAWRHDCSATPLSIDEVFSEAARLFSDEGVVAPTASGGGPIDSALSVDDRQSLALTLLQHGLAQEASAMRVRAKALIDGTGTTRLKLTRTTTDSLSSDIGDSSDHEIDLLPAYQSTRDGMFLRNISCLRPVAGIEQRQYNQDLLRQQLESGRRCSKGDCHERCALGVMDGLVTDVEAFRLIRHFRQVLRKTQRDAKEVKGKPMIDLARSVANSDLSEHLFFVRLVERVRSTASAVFGVPLQRLRLAVCTSR